MIASGDFTGEANTATLLYTDGKIAARVCLIVGLGQSAKFDRHGVRKATATTAKALAGLKRASKTLPPLCMKRALPGWTRLLPPSAGRRDAIGGLCFAPIAQTSAPHWASHYRRI
ncbi:MAG: M17 family peptidase N-terminal domain-containing protein [Caldilineaceae bacterium]